MNTHRTCLPLHVRPALRNRISCLPNVANRRFQADITPSIDKTAQPYPHFSNNEANHTITFRHFRKIKPRKKNLKRHSVKSKERFGFSGCRAGVALRRREGLAGRFGGSSWRRSRVETLKMKFFLRIDTIYPCFGVLAMVGCETRLSNH